MLMKLTTLVDFNNILQAAFSPIFQWQAYSFSSLFILDVAN